MKSIWSSFRPLLIVTGFFIISLSSCNKEEENIPNPNIIRDFDGNEYTIVQIGNQIWMTENLRTTHYNDGTPIALIEENQLWLAAETGAYSWYDNNLENKNDFGALYNAVAAKSEKICPTGWRVPENLDWFRLTTYAAELEGSTSGNLREQGDQFWNTAQGSFSASDRTGFSARGSGIRDIDGSFSDLKLIGAWWVAEENYHAPNWGKVIYIFNLDLLSVLSEEPLGMAIRCIKSE